MGSGEADATAAAPRTYLVERYVPKGSRTELEAFVSRMRDEAATLGKQGVQVAPLWSVYVPTEELWFCVIEATSLEAVDRAAVAPHLTFDRIVEVVAISVDKRMSDL
jgi:hypothetical protein